jgi:hypothetical protein
LHFIDKVLKRRNKELFFIVTPASGPKIDIHFLNPEKDEYTSAYDVSFPDYPPEFYERKNYTKEIFERMNKECRYTEQKWYQELSERLGKDLKGFVLEYCNNIEKITGDLPDIMGFDERGKETLWAEIKFEGFGPKAREAVLKQFKLSQERKIPFLLVIPEKPLYSREISDEWVNNNLPKEMKVYKFQMDPNIVLPKKSQIKFKEIIRK